MQFGIGVERPELLRQGARCRAVHGISSGGAVDPDRQDVVSGLVDDDAHRDIVTVDDFGPRIAVFVSVGWLGENEVGTSWNSL